MYSGIFDRGFRCDTLAIIADKFAAQLRIGALLTDAVKVIADETYDRHIRRVLSACSDDISEGYPLSESLSRHSAIPSFFIETVRAGEKSGNLTSAFDRLSLYYRRKYRVRKKVREAMWYPAFLCTIAAVVVWIVMTQFIPIMSSVLSSSGADIPTPTAVLISISEFLSLWWMYILIGALTLFFASRIVSRTERGALVISQIKLYLPAIGKTVVLSAAGQFAGTAATLISSGLDLPEVIRIAGNSTDNRAVGRQIIQAAEAVESGKSFSEAISTVNHLPRMICEMAAVGEAACTLSETMAVTGEYFDEKATAASEHMLSVAGPIITVIIGGLVAFIVISVFIPILSVYNAIGS